MFFVTDVARELVLVCHLGMPWIWSWYALDLALDAFDEAPDGAGLRHLDYVVVGTLPFAHSIAEGGQIRVFALVVAASRYPEECVGTLPFAHNIAKDGQIRRA